MNYKAVALDLDGTLLNTAGRVSEKTRAKLRELSAAGVVILLATGRYVVQMTSVLEQLNYTGILVSTDGAVTIDVGRREILMQYGFPVQDVASMILQCRERGVHVAVTTAFQYFTESVSDFHQAHYQKYETRYDIIPDLLKIKEPIVKLVVSDHRFVNGWQHIHCGAHLRKRADAEHYKEFVHAHTFKTNALRHVLKQYGIEPEQLISIGDGHNDIDMLQFAGLGIAMGNAPDEVKRAADAVTLTNDEDGVYVALSKWF